MLEFLSEITVNGIELWVVLLCCCGVFLAAFIDAIGGGGGIISVPTYLMAFSGHPTYFVLGTNKVSSSISTFFSTARFVRGGYVDWKLCVPGIVLAVTGSTCGVWLQHHTPDIILKYTLVVVLPIVAFITLRGREWPDEPGEISRKKQLFIVCAAALVIGVYDGMIGPGTGTFLILAYSWFLGMDLVTGSGCAKLCNLASNVAALIVYLIGGKVVFAIGIPAAICAILGNFVGSKLAIKGGAKYIRIVMILVFVLLFVKFLIPS